ncbi:Sec-independent protein translocase [Flavobacterium suaedae]|uniref:Sec-independent protein translocase n=1 Tax=Flavobacterium suaedae TaxID=1767027 RepID=A0ABQ1JYE8_9FLAO|nr:twin-arginine translocase TatA/TatE family subunit [Flavobacterium suaedae]GGB82299.1 Sec-independent protein translocase [Flavobacterium suaedae]
MFGIGGGEIFFIILVVLMLFGSDKVPEMARTLGKGMQQLKNATNDIKHEIHNSADVKEMKNTINKIKADNITKEITQDIKGEVDKVKEDVKKGTEDIENISGPVKRMR